MLLYNDSFLNLIYLFIMIFVCEKGVKYVITVKTGEQSSEKYEGNLGINIISRNFDTGFIKLDNNIAISTAKARPLEKASKQIHKKPLFRRDQKDVFEFEDQDIRTISAIILSRDGRGEEVLYIDYVEVNIFKSFEKQTYRFPFDGWLRMSRQDKKTEILKQRFGKKNSIIAYPNEKPKFEYRVKVSPQITKNTEYQINVDYEIKKVDATKKYKIEFSRDLSAEGNLLIRLTGKFGKSELIKFNRETEPIDKAKNELLFGFLCKECGELQNVSVFYEDSGSKDFELTSFRITDGDGITYEFEINQLIKANREYLVKACNIKSTEDTDEESDEENLNEKGKLEMQLVGQTESTGQFEYDPSECEYGVYKFLKREANIGIIKQVRLRFEGEEGYFASIKSIQIKSNKNQGFSYIRNLSLKHAQEVVLRDNCKVPKTTTVEQDINRQVFVQIFGENKKTGLFQLKNGESDKSSLDVFSTTNYDLGKITNVFIKYEDKSDTRLEVDFIEVIDPRGNSYRFRAEVNLKGEQSIMLPRKAGPVNSDGTTETETETTDQTDSEVEKNKHIDSSEKDEEEEEEEEVEAIEETLATENTN